MLFKIQRFPNNLIPSSSTCLLITEFRTGYTSSCSPFPFCPKYHPVNIETMNIYLFIFLKQRQPSSLADWRPLCLKYKRGGGSLRPFKQENVRLFVHRDFHFTGSHPFLETEVVNFFRIYGTLIFLNIYHFFQYNFLLLWLILSGLSTFKGKRARWTLWGFGWKQI